MAPSACRRVKVNTPPTFPLARNPGGPAPVRHAFSVRRTSSIDTGWPEGYGKPMLMLGRARDVWTGDAGSAPVVKDEAAFRILASANREVLEIDLTPAHPNAARLVGVRAGGQSRHSLADLMADEKAAGTPLYMVLDDFAGASLVSNWIWSQWDEDWHGRMTAAHGGDMEGFRARMINICTGFAEGGSAVDGMNAANRHQDTSRVISLIHPDDPDGWHVMTDHHPVSMRRARWIDVWREAGEIVADIGFQDSGLNPQGGRSAVHEYRVAARIAADTMTLTQLQVDPRILPFPECPGAAAKAQAMVGQSVSGFRQSVLDSLPGTLGCTHLNDVLRAMAEIPQLIDKMG